jgi:hypothetical protein
MTQSTLANTIPIFSLTTGSSSSNEISSQSGTIDLNSLQIDSIDLTNPYYKTFDLNNIAAIPGISQNQYSSLTTAGTIATHAPIMLNNKGISMDETCDIQIGNWSLKDSLERIEHRLGLLQVNPQLEQEWEELKELGSRYRALEADIIEKMKVWNIMRKE